MERQAEEERRQQEGERRRHLDGHLVLLQAVQHRDDGELGVVGGVVVVCDVISLSRIMLCKSSSVQETWHYRETY